MLTSILAFIIVLSALVFVHELGHFLVAKLTGMRVDEFGIGFPPRLLRYQRGETLYCVNAIPLGGYVKIHGENPEEIDQEPNSFQKKPIWARIAVILAGVTMNMLFAFVVLTVAFSVGFISASQDLSAIPGAQVKNSDVLVQQVLKDSPGEKAGIKPGDIISTLSIPATGETVTIKSIPQLQEVTKTRQESGDRRLLVRYSRQGVAGEAEVTLAEAGPPLGVGITPLNTVRIPASQAPRAAVREISYILTTTWDALKGFGQKLFFRAQLDEAVSGPVGIYKATASAAQQGIIPVVFLMVALSVNLALLNVLPIPALDGGKLVFLVIEAVFRRRVIAERLENALTMASIVVLIGLVGLVTVKDILTLF